MACLLFFFSFPSFDDTGFADSLQSAGKRKERTAKENAQ